MVYPLFMETSTILTTKLYVPRPRADLVHRSRLLARLDASLATPLTLISAPAGFGKTTLLTHWLYQYDNVSPTRSAWLSLDEGDNDLGPFLRYFILALQTIEPSLGMTTLSLLDALPMPPMSKLLTPLLNDLVGLTGDAILVLDDYHVIHEPSIHQALTFLLDHPALRLHIVIATREDPPLPLSRLRTRRQLVELRSHDLRFTPDEVSQFLHQVMGITLTPAEVTALEERTEGWIAGLQLAGLSMQDQSDVAGFIAAFTGSHRYVLDYLVEEVLNRQPKPVQTFLLHTSILDRLSANLCDAVLGAGKTDVEVQAQPLLESLEHHNLFVVPLDNERRWYRYHHLFADVLRNRLRHAKHIDAQSLHRRASQWYAEHGFMVEAINHALAGTDYERAADLIEAIGLAQFAQPAIVHSLSRWLATLPPDMFQRRSRLCLVHAWVLFNQIKIPASRQRVDDAERALTMIEPSADSESKRGEVAAMRAMMAAYGTEVNLDLVLASGQTALALLNHDNPTFRSLAAGALGTAYLKQGDVARAELAFSEAAQAARAAENPHLTVAATVNLAAMQRCRGALAEATATCQAALAWMAQRNALLYPSIGGLYCSLADILRERNELTTALRYATDAVTLADQGAVLYLVLVSRFILLRVKLALGDGVAAWALWREITTLAERLPTGVRMAPLPAVAAQMHLIWGDPELPSHQTALARAYEWSKTVSPQVGVPQAVYSCFDFIYQYEHGHLAPAQAQLAYGRVTANQALLRDTLVALEEQRRAAEQSGLPWLYIKSLALLALTYDALAESKNAHAALIRALTLAEPEGYVRVFVDEGEPMAKLMGRLESGDWRLKEYIDRLLGHFQHDVSAYSHTPSLPPLIAPSPVPQRPISSLQSPVSNLQPLLVEPISERELEVLRLIAAGLSNQQIADKLVVTLATVKKHINNLYGKLGVQSRTQALLRARELSLLP